jgi:hypothetical protein
MTLMRVREPVRALRGEAAEALASRCVRAGGTIVMRIGAVDRQSGVGEIIARCRARDNRDLCSAGRLAPDPRRKPPADNYYAVEVPIPERAGTGDWELHQITLVDRDGNRRSYTAAKDFAPVLFRVLGREGLDSTPPRLLGVQVVAGEPLPEGE